MTVKTIEYYRSGLGYLGFQDTNKYYKVVFSKVNGRTKEIIYRFNEINKNLRTKYGWTGELYHDAQVQAKFRELFPEEFI